jgi:hypothetical protein
MDASDTKVPQRRGALRLLWGIIGRPRATLAYVSESGGRSWWLPALLALLLITLPVVVAAPITAQQSREALTTVQEQLGEGRSAEEQAQMDRATSIVASPLITVVFPAVAGVVGRVVGWLVWAGALYLGGMALGGRGAFGPMLRMVIWTWLPYALRGLLQTVYIALSGELILNPGLSGWVRQGSSVREMLAAPPGLGQQVLASVLARIDLFLLWHLILLVIGVRVTMRLSQRKAVLITLGVWVLLTAVSLIPTVIGAAFTQATILGP